MPPCPGASSGRCLTGLHAGAAPHCSMEAAYDAALERLGGLEAAKPKALLELLQPDFAFLTIQARLRSCTRCSRLERRPPTLPGRGPLVQPLVAAEVLI